MWTLFTAQALALPVVAPDHRVEIVSIALRLAQADEYSQATGPYADAVDVHFGAVQFMLIHCRT